LGAKKRLTGAERRIQLIEVGRTVFAGVGYEAASIEEIARQAGVTKPVVYEHFGSKEGLHAAVVGQEMDRLVALVAASIGHGTGRERFAAAVLAFLTWVDEEPEGFAVLTRDAPTAQGRPGLTRVIDDLAARVGDVFAVELKRAGFTAKVAPIYANALIGMVMQVGQWWGNESRAEKKHGSVEQVARHVAALGWMGLRHLPKTPDPLLPQVSPKKAKATR
jgi:AcrR family transcriptional regulator